MAAGSGGSDEDDDDDDADWPCDPSTTNLEDTFYFDGDCSVSGSNVGNCF